ncbi:hypothetical protein [Saccharopolyspora phatthalungensis]|uniref:Uncharacterized protein n=1 Tax=Saccharopolyspora phatthalungensis TaxID=664693 RepID=A0A840Q631_9PSEU|nr:hypothetical protein [Saccharopolyspora phatthalungensis]MBB5154129.1 hypothetical protein [Saccharopolyspora phatthalungensis]
MAIEQVLRLLRQEGAIELDSSQLLVDRVLNEARRKSTENPAYFFRKDPCVVPVALPLVMRVAPVEVLRQVGVATTFDGNSPFAHVSRHWAQLRYCAALETKAGRLSLSPLGNDVVYHHKVAQSEYLGIGFALVVAQEILRKQYPGWEFHPVDADFALARGIPEVGAVNQLDGTQSRPDYFLIGRPSGGWGLKIVVLECKGTHSPAESQAIRQLAKACTQVRAVEIGGRNLASLMVASRLLTSGVKVCVVDPPGETDLWSGSEDELDELLGEDVEGPPEFFGVRTPAQDDLELIGTKSPELGEPEDVDRRPPEFSADDLKIPQVVTIPQASRSWFSQVLARTFAASVLTFAGDGEVAAKYHVPRRYRDDHGQEGFPLDNTVEVDTSERLSMPGGLSARGTRYSMALPGNRRLEVFRGLEESVYADLGEQRLGSYFRTAQRFWRKWREVARNGTADGRAVSAGRDGTVLTIGISE